MQSGEPEASPSILDDWLQREAARAEVRLLCNVSPPDGLPGAIIASPSRSSPDYYYHWVRDSGIAVRAILSLYQAASAPAARQRYRELLLAFVDFSRLIQGTAVSRGTGLGEPKFTVRGEPYGGPWARPQNDGPAIRAIELTRFAFTLLGEGDLALVREKLYDGKLPTTSVIKTDLEYTARCWPDACYDVWEEVRGHHFFTQHLQRRALLEGAALAERLGDAGAARYYREQATRMKPEIGRYWAPGDAYLAATRDANPPPHPLRSGMDSAVVIATLGGYCLDDGPHLETLSPVDQDGVLATLGTLEQVFQAIYAINDPSRGIGGVAIGRYPEDRYDGYRTDALGNPWPSITLAFALFYYKLARRYRKLGRIAVTAGTMRLLQRISPASCRPGGVVVPGDPAFDGMTLAVQQRGDAFLQRVRSLIGPEGSMAEQVDRDTGLPQGARDLTMGYAAFLLAVEARTTLQSTAPAPVGER